MRQVDSIGWLNLVRQHLAWYPLMDPRDVYKLLYQGVLGSEHLVTSPQEFASSVQDECEQQPTGLASPLLEPIRPDAALFRLNLRGCKSAQVNMDLLIRALLETARLVRDSKAELLVTWQNMVDLCDQGQLPLFESKTVHNFNRWLEQAGYPMVHHSHAYTREYRPSYRLVAAQFIHELGFDESMRLGSWTNYEKS